MSQIVSPALTPEALTTGRFVAPAFTSADSSVDLLFRSAQKVIEVAVAAVIFCKGLIRAGSVGYP